MKTGKAAFFSLVLIAALAAGCESGPPKESVSGTILLSPSLPPETRRVRHLFIYLEPGQGGPPFAIQRLVETELPYRFVVTPDDVFARGQFFTGQVRVRARLLGEKLLDPELEPLRLGKLAGALMTGSFEGVSAAVAVGARDVEVVISQAGKAEVRKVAAQKPAELPPSHPPIPQGQAPQAPRPPAPAPQASSAPQAPAPPAGGGGSISGTIVLAPPLAGKAGGKRAVFLIARGEQPGPPLAVVRIADPTFPLAFTISQANVMTPGVKFEGRVRLVARVDADGSAGPPQKGDLEGQAPAPVAVGSTGVRIVVDKEY